MRLLALSLSVFFFVAGCDAFYSVHGHVSSCAEHRPVPGAIVHLSDGEKGAFTKTDRDGKYRAALNAPDGDGRSTLTIAKVGYRTIEHDAGSHVPEDVCLERDEPSSP